MKKLMYYVLVLGALAALSLTGCSSSDDDDGGGSNSLPASGGTNELSGKTVFRDNNKKIEFSVSASGAGTYTLREIKEDENGDDIILANGKYEWIEMATGSYTWNETGEQVYLKPDRVRDEDDGEYSNLFTRNQLINYWKQVYPGEAESVYTTEADRMFAVGTVDYVEASDGTFLLSGGLPANRGANEVSGKTLPVETWGNSNAGSIAFTASGEFTYSANNTSNGSGYEGQYSYDATDTSTWENHSGGGGISDFTGKRIYFKISTYKGMDMEAYYEYMENMLSSMPPPPPGYDSWTDRFESISEAAASQTVNIFNGTEALYGSNKILIGETSMAW